MIDNIKNQNTIRTVTNMHSILDNTKHKYIK